LGKKPLDIEPSVKSRIENAVEPTNLCRANASQFPWKFCNTRLARAFNIVAAHFSFCSGAILDAFALQICALLSQFDVRT
jgi:hypothetical protein